MSAIPGYDTLTEIQYNALTESQYDAMAELSSGQSPIDNVTEEHPLPPQAEPIIIGFINNIPTPNPRLPITTFPGNVNYHINWVKLAGTLRRLGLGPIR